MRLSIIAVLACVLIWGVIAGCSLQYPNGYQALTEHQRTQVDTQFVEIPFNGQPGPKPIRLKNGHHVTVDVRYSVADMVASGGADVRFDVRYEDENVTREIFCVGRASKRGGHRSHFECWSRRDPMAFHFAMAPGSVCDLPAFSFGTPIISKPKCWGGTVTITGNEYLIGYATFGGLVAPGMLTWTRADGQAVQALRTIANRGSAGQHPPLPDLMYLYQALRDIPDADHAWLIMHAFALYQWQKAIA